MIYRLTKELATGSINEGEKSGFSIIDVRDLVDKEGNPTSRILEKIKEAENLLQKKKKVVICCDYGISRSNAIAIGALVKHYKMGFCQAVRLVDEKTGNKEIELSLLHSIRQAVSKEEKSKKKGAILITGAYGFIGSALRKVLGGEYRLITPTFEEIDARKDKVKLDALVNEENVNLIVHLASPSVYNVNSAMADTLLMLKNVLDVSRENRIPLVYPSSWVVFSGYKGKLLRPKEESPLCPEGAYGETKMLCEDLLGHFRQRYGLKAALLRFSPIYGEGSDRPKFIRSFFDKARHNQPIFTHRYNNGLPIIDLLYIDDAASAIKCVIKKGFFGNVHFGGGEPRSTFEIAKKIKKITRSSSEVSTIRIEKDNANVVLKTTRAGKELSWSPKTGLDEGLSKIWEGLKK